MMFPEGLERLSTRPGSSGAPLKIRTIGTVCVAFLNKCADVFPGELRESFLGVCRQLPVHNAVATRAGETIPSAGRPGPKGPTSVPGGDTVASRASASANAREGAMQAVRLR